MIVEIEGIDGVGKTTQCRLLKSWFAERGESAIAVKDLESTELGLHIREKLVSDMPRVSQTELFAFLACKTHLMHNVVLEAVAEGTHVICDRGIGSFVSYFEAHGYARQVILDMLAIAVPVEYHATTILIDLEPANAMARKAQQGGNSKFDDMGHTFFVKQRDIFRDLARADNWLTLDGTLNPQSLHEEVLKILNLIRE